MFLLYSFDSGFKIDCLNYSFISLFDKLPSSLYDDIAALFDSDSCLKIKDI